MPAGSGGAISPRPWSRRVAIIFSPAASIRISDTEDVAPGYAQHVAAIDVLAGEAVADAVGELVVMVAERAGETHAPAQPRDRDRGVAGLTADGDDKIRCLRLGAGVGKFVDPHHDILHGAAGAEDAGRVRSVSQNGSRPPPRRG